MGRARGITIIETIVLIVVLIGLVCMGIAAVLHFQHLQQRKISAQRMKSIYIGLHDYGKSNNDQAPLFYRRTDSVNYFQDSHTLSTGWSHGPASPIWNMMEHKVQTPEELYCPSEENPYFQYNTEENPWTPFELRKVTRLGFSFRPMQAWHTGPGKRRYENNLARLPKVNFNSKTALISNVIITPDKALTVHKGRGTNVAYGDGRIQFVPIEDYYNKYSDMAEPHRLSLWNMNKMNQVWRALDDASEVSR